jgi:pilus assembly protein Flp/PilA
MEDTVKSIKSILADESGQGLAEYGLILGLVAVLCIAAVLVLSGSVKGVLNSVGSSI